jgi:glutathione S-transferase
MTEWSKYHTGVSKPTTIRGVTYPSRWAAAKALNCTPSNVYKAAQEGWLDRVGVKPHRWREELAKREAEDVKTHAAELESKLGKALEALELADATLSGANMNMKVVERKVKAAIAELKGAN